MSDRDDFLAWFNTTWRAAEDALHNGDATPRFRTWSEREPVTLFGAWLDAFGPAAARDVFSKLAKSFSQAGSSDIDLIAADVSGDLAYNYHTGGHTLTQTEWKLFLDFIGPRFK